MDNKDAATIIEELKRENAHLKQQNAELKSQIQRFMEHLKLAQKRQFGPSSERSIPAEQPSLFNEVEKEAAPEVAEPPLETITYKRRKGKGERQAKFKDLPVEIIEYPVPPEEQICPQCGEPMHQMGTQVREELQIIPAQVKIVKHVRHTLACRHCEREGISTPIVTAKAPAPVIPGSYASASTVAHVMNAKYVEGLPLYRQEQQWSRLGVELSCQTMANWVIKALDSWLKPLYHRLHQGLLHKTYLQADETGIQVLHEQGRNAQNKSWMWLYRTGRDGSPIVLYEYKTTRAGTHPKKFLAGFKGYLQVDGYAGYDMIPDVTLVGCWAHARRKFDEALKVLPKDKRTNPGVALEGLTYCNRLFAIEKELKDTVPKERYEERLKRSRPVLDEFAGWLHHQSSVVLPKTLLGLAIEYCRNQWRKLEAFLLDGHLEIDNNRSERSIKPFVIGRKSWLFANTPKGAGASAVVYSIAET